MKRIFRLMGYSLSFSVFSFNGYLAAEEITVDDSYAKTITIGSGYSDDIFIFTRRMDTSDPESNIELVDTIQGLKIEAPILYSELEESIWISQQGTVTGQIVNEGVIQSGIQVDGNILGENTTPSPAIVSASTDGSVGGDIVGGIVINGYVNAADDHTITIGEGGFLDRLMVNSGGLLRNRANGKSALYVGSGGALGGDLRLPALYNPLYPAVDEPFIASNGDSSNTLVGVSGTVFSDTGSGIKIDGTAQGQIIVYDDGLIKGEKTALESAIRINSSYNGEISNFNGEIRGGIVISGTHTASLKDSQNNHAYSASGLSGDKAILEGGYSINSSGVAKSLHGDLISLRAYSETDYIYVGGLAEADGVGNAVVYVADFGVLGKAESPDIQAIQINGQATAFDGTVIRVDGTVHGWIGVSDGRLEAADGHRAIDFSGADSSLKFFQEKASSVTKGSIIGSTLGDDQLLITGGNVNAPQVSGIENIHVEGATLLSDSLSGITSIRVINNGVVDAEQGNLSGNSGAMTVLSGGVIKADAITGFQDITVNDSQITAGSVSGAKTLTVADTGKVILTGAVSGSGASGSSLKILSDGELATTGVSGFKELLIDSSSLSTSAVTGAETVTLANTSNLVLSGSLAGDSASSSHLLVSPGSTLNSQDITGFRQVTLDNGRIDAADLSDVDSLTLANTSKVVLTDDVVGYSVNSSAMVVASGSDLVGDEIQDFNQVTLNDGGVGGRRLANIHQMVVDNGSTVVLTEDLSGSGLSGSAFGVFSSSNINVNDISGFGNVFLESSGAIDANSLSDTEYLSLSGGSDLTLSGSLTGGASSASELTLQDGKLTAQAVSGIEQIAINQGELNTQSLSDVNRLDMNASNLTVNSLSDIEYLSLTGGSALTLPGGVTGGSASDTQLALQDSVLTTQAIAGIEQITINQGIINAQSLSGVNRLDMDASNITASSLSGIENLNLSGDSRLTLSGNLTGGASSATQLSLQSGILTTQAISGIEQITINQGEINAQSLSGVNRLDMNTSGKIRVAGDWVAPALANFEVRSGYNPNSALVEVGQSLSMPSGGSDMWVVPGSAAAFADMMKNEKVTLVSASTIVEGDDNVTLLRDSEPGYVNDGYLLYDIAPEITASGELVARIIPRKSDELIANEPLSLEQETLVSEAVDAAIALDGEIDLEKQRLILQALTVKGLKDVANKISDIKPASFVGLRAIHNIIADNRLGVTMGGSFGDGYDYSSADYSHVGRGTAFSFMEGSGWGQLVAGSSRHKEVDGRSSFDGNMTGFVVGADFDLTHTFRVGGAGSWTKNSVKAENDASADMHNFMATLYGHWYLNGWYVDSIFSAGKGKTDTGKFILGNPVSASYKSTTYGARLIAGHAFGAGNWDVIPQAELHYGRMEFDVYEEKGNSGFERKINIKDYDVLEFGLGFSIGRAPEHGYRFRPTVDVVGYYDVKNNGTEIQASYLAGGDDFSVTGPSRDKFRLKTGLGMEIDVLDSWMLSANYNMNWSKHFLSHSFSGKVRYAF
ncbi:autotransporter outer membrane beta-barrel domain-containing protein [Candidatus Sororendozoicomonas aggregata]|uniref:autotransporter outer membrane beta-barrel domain-containing protein n=1 Tax=Candidatus Sororendozoicomonas aggregata TaxID=3073239 RepID=UPI002ED5870E